MLYDDAMPKPEYRMRLRIRPSIRSSHLRSRRAAVAAVLALTPAGGAVMYDAVSPAAAQATPVPPPKAQEAAAALQRGDYEQAIQLYTAALDDTAVSNDRRAVLLTERGVAYMKRRSHKAALDDFNKAATIYPEYAAVYVNRGNLLLVLNQGPDTVREAIRDFDRALVLSPGLAAAYGNRGAALLKLGQFDAAVADFTRAIELLPQNPAALNGRGRARLLAGRLHASVRDFTRAVAINPGFAQSYRNRSEANMRLSLPADAVEDLSRALAFDARRVEDYAARGEAYLAAGNIPAALTDFEKVVELEPKSVSGHIGRGIAKARGDATEDALGDLSRAIELEPRSARAYAVRAWIYKKNQQPELGEKDVERALRLEPVTADAFWAQGEIKEAAGERDAAIAAYSRALGLDIRHRETLEALARLGLEPQREEIPVADAGIESWRVSAVNGQFVAVHPQFPALRVALEMMGQGKPKLTAWERQKAPNANYGLLQYSAGLLQVGQATETVECTAVIDLASMVVVGMPVTKLGGRKATFDWDDSRLAVTGADGLAEVIPLRQKAEQREVAAAAAAAKRTETQQASRRENSQGSQREASNRGPQRKPKTIFDLIFGQ